MTRTEQIQYLTDCLLHDLPQYRQQAARLPFDDGARRQFLRGLMNLHPPLPLTEEFLTVQDALLGAERDEKGVVSVSSLSPSKDPRLFLWQGDITRLAADAIVNAANSSLLGCFLPLHGCIDNAIHSAAGLQLRRACEELMEKQGHEEATGMVKITPGYNLPAAFVFHTVGPVVQGRPTPRNRADLANCYRSCLKAAMEKDLDSLAFCCLSTGEFHFPHPDAAQIAVSTVQQVLNQEKSQLKVIFNVFQSTDARLYRALL